MPGLRSLNATLEQENAALQKRLESLKSENERLRGSNETEKRRFAEKISKLEATIENLRARQVGRKHGCEFV